jgi:GT2 family glycosyltransferase
MKNNNLQYEVSLVIVNWNTSKELQQCLKSFYEASDLLRLFHLYYIKKIVKKDFA